MADNVPSDLYLGCLYLSDLGIIVSLDALV